MGYFRNVTARFGASCPTLDGMVGQVWVAKGEKTMKTSKDLKAEADELEKQLHQLRKEAAILRRQEFLAIPLAERLVYAADSRCPCKAGLAYDPAETGGYWDCSKILLGTADQNVQHTGKLSFMFYEVLSEKQPSANGRTTRP